MRVWTEEQKAKAAATRAETKRKKEEKAARKREADRQASDPAYGAQKRFEESQVKISISAPSNGHDVDWRTIPLEEGIARLGVWKRQYDLAMQIITGRQGEDRKKWTCWTQFHKDTTPAALHRICVKTGEDGRWRFRDDGVFKTVDGIRVPDPVFCCSSQCTEYYLKSKSVKSVPREQFQP